MTANSQIEFLVDTTVGAELPHGTGKNGKKHSIKDDQFRPN